MNRWIAVGIALWLVVPRTVAADPGDAERLERLDRRVAELREQGAAIRAGRGTQRLRDDAVELREQAMKPLESWDWADAALVACGHGVEKLKEVTGQAGPMDLYALMDRAGTGSSRSVAAAAVQVTVLKGAKDTVDLVTEARASKGEAGGLDVAAQALDAQKGILGATELFARVAPVEAKIVEGQLGVALAGIDLYRAFSHRDDAKLYEKHLWSAYKNFRDGSTTMLAAGGAEAAGEVAVLGAGADAWWRIGHLIQGQYEARNLDRQASVIQSDMENLALRLSLVADWERDQVRARLAREGRRPAKEPGGIKVSGSIADRLGLNLDLTAIKFDPVSRTVSLAGTPSKHAIPMAVFLDALRLAQETHDPSFSLDPVKPEDWDRSGIVAWGEIERRWLAAPGGRRKLARRMKEVGVPLELPGGTVWTAPLDAVDRSIDEHVMRTLDDREELVFSPRWLAFTRLGWILYEGDMAIKAVAAGFDETGHGIVPADVWSIPGFRAMWQEEDHGAGRANFELDPVPADDHGGALDLSQVRMRLTIVHRIPGTNTDAEPCDQCRARTAFFTAHWREFVDRVPAIGRLHQALQAYVAARCLLRAHPGLAAALAALPPPGTDERPPVLDRRALALRIGVDEKGNPKPWNESGRWHHISLGYSGGITVNASAVRVQAAGESPDWERETFGPPGPPGASQTVRGVCIDLAITGPQLPVEGQLALWGACLAAAAGLALAERRRIADTWRSLACRRCAGIHRAITIIGTACDVVASASLAFLFALPIAVAADAEPAPAATLAAAGLALGGVLSALAVAASAVRVRGGPATTTRTHGRVARWLGLGLFLGRGPVRLAWLLGVERSERLLVGLAGTGVAAAALGACAAAAALSLYLRWVHPFLAGSRPRELAGEAICRAR